MTDEQIAQRRPVWIALADLFLDTDVRLLYPSIAQRLASSPFSFEELQEILKKEVAPVLRSNLFSVAGEWAGFDENWLVEQMVQQAGKRRWPAILFPVQSDWQAVVYFTARLRSLPEDVRARRSKTWGAIIDLLLTKDAPVRPGGFPLKELEKCLREDLQPAPIKDMLPAYEIDRNWRRMTLAFSLS